MKSIIDEKAQKLLGLLEGLKRVAVAFSGGVDSALLAAAAVRALGSGAVAVTAESPTLSMRERRDAGELAALLDIRHEILVLSELECPEFVKNDGERCYHCKKFRFEKLCAWAKEKGIPRVVEGSNVDDKSDYRPGMRAVAELPGVSSPLLESGFSKAEIRELSRRWGLPTWEKPAAACLASRISYGTPLTRENLARVERAEEIVGAFCPPNVQYRVRDHGPIARIEAEREIIPLLADPERGDELAEALGALGFKWVTLDLEGYRMGSLNDQLKDG